MSNLNHLCYLLSPILLVLSTTDMENRLFSEVFIYFAEVFYLFDVLLWLILTIFTKYLCSFRNFKIFLNYGAPN